MKPREFWIRTNKDHGFSCEVVDSEEAAQELSFDGPIIHAVEYSAYEQAVEAQKLAFEMERECRKEFLLAVEERNALRERAMMTNPDKLSLEMLRAAHEKMKVLAQPPPEPAECKHSETTSYIPVGRPNIVVTWCHDCPWQEEVDLVRGKR